MHLPRPRDHTKQKLSVRTADEVVVISGKDRGKRGKVVRVDRDRGRVVVEGVNIAHRHTKPSQKLLQGGVVDQPNPVAASSVMVVCPSCRKPTRIGHLVDEEGRRHRRCVLCGKAIDRR
jgi:large subunit ribosomal protein L24